MSSYTVILFAADGSRLRRFEVVAWSRGTALRRAHEAAAECGAVDLRVLSH